MMDSIGQVGGVGVSALASMVPPSEPEVNAKPDESGKGRLGEVISKQSLLVTDGEANKAAAILEKATPRARVLDDAKQHVDPPVSQQEFVGKAKAVVPDMV